MNYESARSQKFANLSHAIRLQRGLALGIIIITALIAFEMFNYSTTEFALSDLLGDLTFLGIRWATILSIAFCGIDFAGIARLFTPEISRQGRTSGQSESWYLFGAWLLAATMNAMLTWWGVSRAILEHHTPGNAIIQGETLLRVVPIFVAILVWLIRVLIIGAFSVAGERLFTQGAPSGSEGTYSRSSAAISSTSTRSPINHPSIARASTSGMSAARSTPKTPGQMDMGYTRPEPTYHSLSMSAARNHGSQE